ncbi:MAG: response regulator [Candidatus Methanoperedens sp.]
MTKALVVDDDPLSIEYVVEMLTTCGFMAETAVNGEEAVKKAQIEVYDLIIMDIELPGMDGAAATRIIKSKPGYENTPAIALTAYAMKGDRERFLAEGFNEYFSKPANVADFLKMLKKYRK